MPKLSLFLWNRGPEAPPGVFIAQLILREPAPGESSVFLTPNDDDVTTSALADALRELATKLENEPEQLTRDWYTRKGPYTPPLGSFAHVAREAAGVDVEGKPDDVCSACEHFRADHMPASVTPGGDGGCNACRKYGPGNAVCMRFRGLE